MTSFDKAFRRLIDLAKPIGTEILPLERTGRRRLADPVTALVDSPASDLSAMDGYAVKELKNLSWHITGDSYAGEADPPPLNSGECRYVTTGARIPENCQSVIPHELVEILRDKVSLSGRRPQNLILDGREKNLRLVI
ncbi:hypothetical protein [Sphingopyxis sp. BSNA05]|uniref:hypothetical protein n=1 Tax=Sphingopyxis sp. BSNA05 TaxID=1236614 RepID=UPI001C27DCB4